MNRPNNITPAPGLGSSTNSYRGPYPSSGGPNPQASQTSFGVPRASSALNRNGYPYSMPTVDDQQRQRLQTSALQQQHAMQQQLQQYALGHQQQSQSMLPPQPPSSSQQPLSTDPTHFPALGSTVPSNGSASHPNNGQVVNGHSSSYASQLAPQPRGSLAPNGIGGATGGGFGADEFPALGQSAGGHSNNTHNQGQSTNFQQPLSDLQSHSMHDLSVQTPLKPQSQGNANVPQTPAQQVLISPADRWGLLGLLAVIRSADPDTALLGMGTDLGAVGLDMGNQDNLYSSFITPWSDATAALAVEPDFHVPACYNVQPTLPGPTKAASFSDETLFWMFYSSPRDVLQEVAAQELYNRNWRFHKDIRLWLTKESGTAPSVKTATYERGVYTFFDPENWERVKKDTVIVYDLLEEKIPLGGVLGGVPVGGPQQQGPPPPGMNVLGPGSGPNQPQQHQLHQSQIADVRHRHGDLQGMQNPRYPGVGTPGLGL